MNNDGGNYAGGALPVRASGPDNSSRLHPPAVSLAYQGPDFTWEQAFRILKKNRRFGSAIALAILAGVVMAVLLMKNEYQPVARVEIAPPASGIQTVNEIQSSAQVEDQDYLDTQIQILQSDGLAVSVIRQLRLDKLKEFAGTTPPAQSADTASDDSNGFANEDKSSLQEQMSLATLTPAESVALKTFEKNLSVDAIRNTRLVEVSYSSNDPQLAQRITNEMVAKFIQNDYKQRYDATTEASQWLSSQLDDLYQKVITSNQAVANYQKKNGLVEMDDNDVPLSQLMSEVNHQLSDSEAARIENEAYLRMIEAGQVANVPAVRDDKIYQDLAIRQGDIQAQLAQAKVVYGDENANVKKLQDELDEVTQGMIREQQRIGDEIRTAYAASKERETLMQQNREHLQNQMVDVNSHLVTYNALKSEALANTDLYNTLQARLKEAGIYAGLGSTNIRVIDLAENLQEPTGPHRTAIVAMGGLASALAGILACVFKESMNNTVRTPEDLRSWVGLRSLALLPVMTSGEHLNAGRSLTPVIEGYSQRSGTNGVGDWDSTAVTLMRPLTAEAEAMRELRTVLLASKRGSGGNVVLISSAIEGEGKTTVALNLAVALAQVGRTCVIDADLRRPTLSRAVAREAKPGLVNVLADLTPLSAVLTQFPGVPGLSLLPSGSTVQNPADILVSSGMQNICEALRRQFQFVVIDSPPIIRFSDARYLSRLADDVVLVGRYGVTTRRVIQRSTELLQDVQAPLVGVVLNGIDYSSPDYHYFTYGYSREATRRGDYAYASTGPAVPPTDEPPTKGKGAHA
jgi:succinoglycan biosynthesis transport protein ExoP